MIDNLKKEWYTMVSEFPEVHDTLDILNLHYFKRDSYIDKLMSCHHLCMPVDGRDLFAVTHLARS